MSRSLRSGAVGVALGVVIASGVAAIAAIPGTNEVYAACMSPQRTIKMLDHEAGERCPRKHELLRWNQRGQPGPSGTDATRTAFTAQRLEDYRFAEPGESIQVAEFDAPNGYYFWDVAVAVTLLDGTAPGRLSCTFGWAPQSGGYNRTRGAVEVGPRTHTTLYMSALGYAAAVEGPQGIYCTAHDAAVQITEWRVVGRPIDSLQPLTMRN